MLKTLRNLIVAAFFVVAALFVTTDRANAFSSCEAWSQTCTVVGGHLTSAYSWCDWPEEIHRMWCIRDYDGERMGVRDCSYRGEEWCSGDGGICDDPSVTCA